MRKLKFTGLLCVLIALSTSLTVPAMAVQPQTPQQTASSTISSRWVNAYMADATISASSKQLTSGTIISAYKSTSSINGTLYLEKKSGTSWSVVTSWPISGSGKLTVSKKYAGAVSATYRTRVSVTVNSEKIEKISGTCTI